MTSKSRSPISCFSTSNASKMRAYTPPTYASFKIKVAMKLFFLALTPKTSSGSGYSSRNTQKLPLLHTICRRTTATSFSNTYTTKHRSRTHHLWRKNHLSRCFRTNIKFIDSLCFIPMKLADFPKTFGLTELEKGYFPHLFNRAENQDYVGPMPDVKYYDPNSMSPDDRDTKTWYKDNQSNQNQSKFIKHH